MNKEQQNKAKNLYFQTGLSVAEIADFLEMPRRTLHYWIREQSWDVLKLSAAAMPILITENVYQVLARYTNQLLSEEARDVPVTVADANAIYKLTMAVCKLKSRTTLNENMQMLTCFAESVQSKSPQMAEALSPYIDEYLKAGASNSERFMPARPLSHEEDMPEAEATGADVAASQKEAGVANASGISPEQMEAEIIQCLEVLKTSEPPMAPELLRDFPDYYRHNREEFREHLRQQLVAA